MLRSPFPPVTLLCSVLLAWASTGCTPPQAIAPTPAPIAPSPSSPPAAPLSPTGQAQEQARPTFVDPYQTALDRAESAANIGQSAQSRDDWKLAESRWQQTIDLMASVPQNSPNFAESRRRLNEYRRNLAAAQQKAARPVGSDAPVVVRRSPRPAASPETTGAAPTASPDSPVAPQSATIATASPAPQQGDRFTVPIVRREGGTPVVRVTFNNRKTYDMIVDTGASGTVVTATMANELRIAPTGQATVTTASASGVQFPLGYVESVQVGELSAQNLRVAIAPPTLNIGLLGQDFFSQYDITIRQNVVEFQHR